MCKNLLSSAFLLAAATYAHASVVTLGLSNQPFVLTGLGPTPSGQGQTVVTFGSCVFADGNTTCTITGAYTGLNNDGGGAYTFTLTYQGNGPSPLTFLTATPTAMLANPPSTDVQGLNLSSGSLLMTFKSNNGVTTSFYYTTGFYFQFATAGTCTGVIDCRPGTVGQTKDATMTGAFTGNFDTTPILQGVISASDYGGFSSIAPGTWIEIFGYNLSTNLNRVWGGADFNGDNAPTTLAGTTLTIGGQRAFIDFAGPGQVNAQVPSNIAAGPQPVVLTTAGGPSAITTVTVNTVQPGLLAPATFRKAAGQYITAVFSDGTTFVLPPGLIPVLPSRRARVGEVITFYGIGFGHETPDVAAGIIVRQTNTLQMPVTVSFGGVPAPISYQGSVPGYLGLYQFNVTVPNVPASDAVPVTFTLGGAAGSQTLITTVQ